MRTIYPRKLNKMSSATFTVVYPDQHTPNEGLKSHRPKHYDNNNKHEVYNPNVISENIGNLSK